MSTTRGGEQISAQISKMGVVTGLNSGNFSVKDGTVPFNIKNDGEDVIELEVNLWGMQPGNFIKTTCDVGWNCEIVREIKATDSADLNLKWGY